MTTAVQCLRFLCKSRDKAVKRMRSLLTTVRDVKRRAATFHDYAVRIISRSMSL